MTILALLLAAVSIISAIFFIGRWGRALNMLDDVVMCNIKIVKREIDMWADKHGRYPESFEMVNDGNPDGRIFPVNPFFARQEPVIDGRYIPPDRPNPWPGEIRYTFRYQRDESGARKTGYTLEAYGAGGRRIYDWLEAPHVEWHFWRGRVPA